MVFQWEMLVFSFKGTADYLWFPLILLIKMQRCDDSVLIIEVELKTNA